MDQSYLLLSKKKPAKNQPQQHSWWLGKAMREAYLQVGGHALQLPLSLIGFISPLTLRERMPY